MVTPHSCGQRRRFPHDRIESLRFYLVGLNRLSGAQKLILILIADCHGRSPPGIFQPSLPTLAKQLSCSRKTAWRALRGLDGHHGWIINEWKGGHKSNEYKPGWRLQRVLLRYSKKGLGKR